MKYSRPEIIFVLMSILHNIKSNIFFSSELVQFTKTSSTSMIFSECIFHGRVQDNINMDRVILE